MNFSTFINTLYYPKVACSLPKMVMVEPTDACNLKCVMCDVQQQKKGDFHFIAPEQFEFILNQLPHMREIVFCGIGEPLLNRSIFLMISLAKKHGISFINLITNGELLNQEISEKLLHSGLNQLHISIPGVTEVTFNKIRNNPAVSLEKLSESVKYLTQRRDAEQLKLKVIINIVMMNLNYFELEDAVSFCKDLGADGICFAQLTTIFGKNEKINLPRNNSIAKLFSRIKRMGNKLGLKIDFLTGNDYGRCYQLWNFMMVHANGNISPCNGIMPTENMNLGNIFNEDIKQIWMSEPYKELRQRVRESNLANCNFCESGYLIEGKNWNWRKNFYLRPLRHLIARKIKRTDGI